MIFARKEESLYRIAVALERIAAHSGSEVDRKLDRITNLLLKSREREISTMATIDDILASVAEFTTIEESLDAVFAQLQALIQQGQTDPAKLQQALDLVDAHKQHTKDSILANTPQQP